METTISGLGFRVPPKQIEYGVYGVLTILPKAIFALLKGD